MQEVSSTFKNKADKNMIYLKFIFILKYTPKLLKFHYDLTLQPR